MEMGWTLVEKRGSELKIKGRIYLDEFEESKL
jgi:hypothetical protein